MNSLAHLLKMLLPACATCLLCTSLCQSVSVAASQDHARKLEELRRRPELVLETGGFLTEISDIAFSPDGKTLAVSGGYVVRLFDSHTGMLLTTLRGDMSRGAYGSCAGIAFSPDGRFLLVGVYDHDPRGSVRIYRTDNLKEIDSLLRGHSAPCGYLKFTRDGRYLLSTDSNGRILIFDWGRRKLLKTVPPRNPEHPIVDAACVASSDPYFITVEFDRPHIYSIPAGNDLTPPDYIPPKQLNWLGEYASQGYQWPFDTSRAVRVVDVAFDNNIWCAAGVGKSGGKSRYWAGVWNGDSSSEPSVLYTAHKWEITTVAISRSGSLVASGDKFGEVHVWDAKTGSQIATVSSAGEPVYSVALDNERNYIAFANKPDLKKWNYNHFGELQKSFDLKTKSVYRSVKSSFSSREEVTEVGQFSVKVSPASRHNPSDHLQLFKNSRFESEYKLESGRRPTVYSLLETSALGVETPVVFGDNEGQVAVWDTSGTEMRRYCRGHNGMVTAISRTAQNDIFLTSSTDRTIRIWSLKDFRPTGIFDFEYVNNTVLNVPSRSSSAKQGVKRGDEIVSFDGMDLNQVYEYMLYGKFDYQPGQTVPVVFKRQGREFQVNITLSDGFDYAEPVLNLFLFGESDWIMWTPDGFYDCSPGADRLIGWHVNNGPDQAASFYTVQQFRKILHRPELINDIVVRGLSRAEPTAVHLRKRADLESVSPPVVDITTPQPELTFNDPRVNVEAVVTTTNSQSITKVTLLQNGYVAGTFFPSNEEERERFTIRDRVRLRPGRNVLSFVAENAVTTSNPDQASITLYGIGSRTPPSVYALVIGLSQYKNSGQGFESLQFAADDALSFVQTLRAHENGELYENVTVKTLVDEEATRERILNGVQWLVNNVSEGDIAMVFASAHGFLDRQDNFYLATHDIDVDALRATGISWRELVGTLQEDLPACQRFVFLDTCHSGAIATPSTSGPLHDLAAPEVGTAFFASCTMQQQSLEDPEWRHGAFMKAFLDLVHDPASDVVPSTRDGFLNCQEVDQGLVERVRVLTGDRQTPVIYFPTQFKQLNFLEASPEPLNSTQRSN